MGRYAANLVNRKFAKWTVINRHNPPTDKQGSALWLCQCDCGNRQVLPSRHLRRAESYLHRSGGCRQCGIRTDTGESNDITGKIFGPWRVIHRIGTYGDGKNRKSLWLCSCQTCGIEKEIVRGTLVIGSDKHISVAGKGDTTGLGRPPHCQNCRPSKMVVDIGERQRKSRLQNTHSIT